MLLTQMPADHTRRQSHPVKQPTTWGSELPTDSRDWHSIKSELQKYSEPQEYYKERDAEKSLNIERNHGKTNQINILNYLTKLGSNCGVTDLVLKKVLGADVKYFGFSHTPII